MNKKETENNQEPLEFTASDVKKIHASVDEKNGFHINFTIHKFRAEKKALLKLKQKE